MHSRHFGQSHGHHHLHARILPRELEETNAPEPPILLVPEPIDLRSIGGQLVPRTNDLDEKPSGTSNALTIALSIVIPLLVATAGVFYVARRGMLRRRQEDAATTDKYRSMDFGLDESTAQASGKRRSGFFGKEKTPNHKTQLSMDMNLSSPYLLPPTVHGSRESMNSLTKNLHLYEDPYRHIPALAGSEVGSIRSFQRGPAGSRTSSIYTNKPPHLNNDPTRRSQQRDVPPFGLVSPPPAAQRLGDEGVVDDAPIVPSKNEFRFVDNGPRVDQVPGVEEPPAVANNATRKSPPQDSSPMLDTLKTGPQPQVAEFVNARDSVYPSESEGQKTPDGLGIMENRTSHASSKSKGSGRNTLTAERPPRKESMPVVQANVMEDYGTYADHFQVDEPTTTMRQHDDELHMPFHNQPEPPHSAGLGVPGTDSRRLSVGLRPLPPDDFLESEDPEFRANRIRSFYKEYFEDITAEQDRPPMPQQPPAGYYEDYDAGYMGDAAYYDPDSNAFVMPYAQPVTRRAMTPPPSNRRPMPGPRQRGPPGPHGGMRIPGGPPGRSRAGSTMSGGRFGPMSPRPGSSASNPRFGGKPKKALPPPAALSTLPTPSKLRDDSFAIFNAADFAPPSTFRDQAAGRSQSPVGERMPYRVNTPVHSPLVSAFDETAALPSPHLLRKSGTFTGLDFAPPRRFKDPESMSETGSVRSMQSGISNAGLSALRAGAGRVSRLPGDTVFTQASLGDQLKPQWGMRP
ncbi:hypothetical protein GGR57DRAFT_356104 [Xylariaceae sp. FL1272]|nr:hypothetical protein GGR57DRAFT_356104 [Xylariaceae sp. FL1272]